MIKKFLLATTMVFMALSASAQNRDKCYWMVQPPSQWPDTASRTATLEFPQSQELKLAPIGRSMGGGPLNYNLQSGRRFIQCPVDTVPYVSISYWLSGAALVPGYSDVYRTNLPGVGFRITALRNSQSTIPFDDGYKNSSLLAASITNFYVDFIRTAYEIKTGDIDLNINLYAKFHDWTALTLSATGRVSVTTNEYFSGCAGAPTTNIPLGKVLVQDLAQRKKHRFNLEVVCAGAPAGSKLPVKVYFDGSSNGPGRLNLTPGGATGVEIALTSNSMKLPFSVSSALNMDWLRTESGGERYTLPIVAGYERIGNSKVEVGKADATMNYVIEYN